MHACTRPYACARSHACTHAHACTHDVALLEGLYMCCFPAHLCTIELIQTDMSIDVAAVTCLFEAERAYSIADPGDLLE